MDRIQRLFRKLEAEGVEALLISGAYNRRYVTGFTGSSGWALVTANEVILLTDFRYLEQAEQETEEIQIVEHLGGQMGSKIKEICEERLQLNQLYFEAEHINYAEYAQLASLLPEIELLPSQGLIESLRQCKEKEEIETISQAVHMADETFQQIIQEIRPGMTEQQVALRIEWILRELGAEGTSFSTIVASGTRSSRPHGVASDKVLQKGDLVIMDFGALYNGYVSDMTRTVVLGTPTEQQREMHQVVYEALEHTKSHMRSGMSVSEVDALARDWITEAGYGEAFGHATGHGIGLEVHESPRLGKSSNEILQEGMVVTVEPGIYLSGIGGVRIEDNVLVIEKGIKTLTQSPRELISISC